LQSFGSTICSANAITSTAVDETVVDRFMDYRTRCGKPADDALRSEPASFRTSFAEA
jgi:hypothetical protein